MSKAGTGRLGTTNPSRHSTKNFEAAELKMEISSSSKKHFILVHGLCHGAWCWYRVVAALRAAGHRATALDMAASGAHPARVDEVGTFEEYSRPLLDAVAAAAAPGERLVLVGHSHGGLSVALAMERFPDKVAAAVFVAAAMPCVGKHMGFMRRTAPEGLLMDCEMVAINNSQGSGVAINLGPTFLVQKYYQQSPAEDLALAKMLVRPGNQFMDDPVMKDESLLTNGNYGSVKKVYVIAKADSSSTEEMQRWMVAMSPGTDVEEIAGADHAVMNSKPRELCDILIKIANKYERANHKHLQEMEGSSSSSKHFILVHGLCHGAWCWYKVVTMLRSEWHRVTALDLAASGVHPARIDEVHSFEEYSQPLLDAVAEAPAGERLILVGHSFGGLSIALAMERFPEKIAVAVFVAAAVPCVGKHIGIIPELIREKAPKDMLLDSKMIPINNKQGPGTAILLGPNFLAEKGYPLSPAEAMN
uniref:AB hydrolase-1 domain-containing protein n=1 Tax=Oryza nivara TaxID=4536 RepID=A0A0E0FYG1_ORYNI